MSGGGAALVTSSRPEASARAPRSSPTRSRARPPRAPPRPRRARSTAAASIRAAHARRTTRCSPREAGTTPDAGRCASAPGGQGSAAPRRRPRAAQAAAGAGLAATGATASAVRLRSMITESSGSCEGRGSFRRGMRPVDDGRRGRPRDGPDVRMGAATALQRLQIGGRHGARADERGLVELPGRSKRGRELVEIVRREPSTREGAGALCRRTRRIARVSHNTTNSNIRRRPSQMGRAWAIASARLGLQHDPPGFISAGWSPAFLARIFEAGFGYRIYASRIYFEPNSARSASSQSSATLPTVSSRSSNSS